MGIIRRSRHISAEDQVRQRPGLGGLLIWSIDQDTDDLEALRAVIYPKTLNAYSRGARDQNHWEDAAMGDCRVTDCGLSCNPGEILISKQPCGSAKAVTRHSNQQDSSLCCPLSSAPDPRNAGGEAVLPHVMGTVKLTKSRCNLIGGVR
jgi:chitinase